MFNGLQKLYVNVVILVLNGASNIRPNGRNYFTAAEATFRVNYYGNSHVLRELFPLVRPGGRIGNNTFNINIYITFAVAVSSMISQRTFSLMRSNKFKAELDSQNKKLTLEQLDILASEFLENCKNGPPINHGWTNSIYGLWENIFCYKFLLFPS